MKPKFPVMESTLDYQTGEFRVRVWRTIKTIALHDATDLKDAARRGMTADAIIQNIAKLPDVSAIQVVWLNPQDSMAAHGIVVYLEWP